MTIAVCVVAVGFNGAAIAAGLYAEAMAMHGRPITLLAASPRRFAAAARTPHFLLPAARLIDRITRRSRLFFKQ